MVEEGVSSGYVVGGWLVAGSRERERRESKKRKKNDEQ
jgi:hypothetical protein